jgi:hypothetical protein
MIIPILIFIIGIVINQLFNHISIRGVMLIFTYFNLPDIYVSKNRFYLLNRIRTSPNTN